MLQIISLHIVSVDESWSMDCFLSLKEEEEEADESISIAFRSSSVLICKEIVYYIIDTLEEPLPGHEKFSGDEYDFF